MYKCKYFLFSGIHLKHSGTYRIEAATLDGALKQAEQLMDRIFPNLTELWGAYTDTEVLETETHSHCKIKRYAHSLNADMIGRVELHWKNKL